MFFLPRGIIPPIVTPFEADGSINYAAYRKMIDFLINNGVHGIFVMGTTGEYYAIGIAEYRRILEETVNQTAGRVPVYAGANHITTRGAIELVKICEGIKVDAVTVLTPMFISQTQDELYAYFKTIAENTSLPIIIYNNKPKTNITVEPDTVARLAELPNIAGIKDSTGDLTNTIEYIRLTRHRSGFHVLMGRDTLIYAGLCHGASGAVATCANIAPRLVADIYDKYMAGDFAAALEAQFELAPLRMACNMGTFPSAIKESLSLLGMDAGKCMPPIAELADNQKEKLRSILINMKLI